MSPKHEKLQTRIQEIQKFVSTNFERDRKFRTVFQELEKIAACLKTEKIKLQIVSTNSIAARSLQIYFERHRLSQFYQVGVSSLPKQIEPVRSAGSATLVLSTSSNEKVYPLSTTETTSIGRNPDSEIAINSSLYKKVSWNHAQISPCGNLAWEICDRNSTNGTYINGVRLQGCQKLQTGDRITLAASASSAYPEFVFEYSLTTEYPESLVEILDCDILCLVCDLATLRNAWQGLITIANTVPIAKRVVIGSIPSLTQVEAWLRTQDLSDVFELVVLSLSSFSLQTQTSEINSVAQQELEKFCQSLETFIKGKPEDILAQRLTARIIKELSVIEQVLDREAEAIAQQLQQEEARIKCLATDDVKEQAKKALRKASDDKDKFFKQVKLELNQSKAALLDTYSKKSITYKVEEFIERLKPQVLKKGGFQYIQLRTENPVTANGNVNADLTYFCSHELKKWADKEWQLVTTTYGEGGLNTIVETVYKTLNFLPSINLDKSLFYSDRRIDIQKSLMNSFIEAPYEGRYQGVSPLTYVLKQIRANMMQFTFLVGFGAMFVGIRVSGGGKQVISSITQPLRENPILFGIVIFLLICLLTYTYQKDTTLQLEAIADKLRKELSNHYQSLSKNLVEKLVLEITTVLETEEKRLKDALEIANDKFNAYIIDIEKNQLLLKSNLEQQKIQLRNLDKEKVDLQKLKRF
ncbi:FHA domain-containing protein [Chroococcidiopsis sp. FACHB-1243]|uniref:FHA domain-containing protein n=1 Tax=Chroococcidiopsis sp. [FACHB-1243] TaxID=2692781 RepID=UPI00177FC76D|nr:FHA domain-containing protein [Chroococcidiopsis sp. [FACHB-1243]]MBD2308227.1 FHA domain-containing protein [Chroococcidiopsis sp. [FACHB-1243]]